MESKENRNDDFPIKLVVLGVVVWGIVQVINAVVAAITAFLMGLVYIALVTVGIVALFWVYRHITDKQYGETKKLQQIEKLERERKLHVARVPKHMKESVNQHYIERQNAVYDLKPRSRVEEWLDWLKQVASVFRRREK